VSPQASESQPEKRKWPGSQLLRQRFSAENQRFLVKQNNSSGVGVHNLLLSLKENIFSLGRSSRKTWNPLQIEIWEESI
jgi:hypothetical protein